jgi:hypothetical protein
MNDRDPLDDSGTGIEPVSTITHETGIDRRDPRRCTATNRAGQPCGKYSMRGGTVCRAHGGAAPQTKAKAAAMVELAELRLRNLAPKALDVLERLLTAESEAVSLAAARDVTDRAVGKPRERVDVAASIQVVRPW